MASASFSVERDGAPRGRCSRGMPIAYGLPHGAALDADEGVRAVDEEHVQRGQRRAGVIGVLELGQRAVGQQLAGERQLDAAAQRPTAPCRRWCPASRRAARQTPRRVRWCSHAGQPAVAAQGGAQRGERRDAIRSPARAWRDRTARAGRCRRRASARTPAVRPRARAASAARRRPAAGRRRSRGPSARRRRSSCLPRRRRAARSAAASASKPARQWATITRHPSVAQSGATSVSATAGVAGEAR